MPRVTDANILFSGTEPKFSVELSAIDMIKTLSWYSQNKDSKDAYKYACDYFKKFHKLDVSSSIKSRSPTFGFVCRIVYNGGILSTKDQIWFDKEVQKVKDDLQNNFSLQSNTVVVKTNVISIQDRIRDKANECIAELESQVDDFILSGCSANVSPYGIFNTLNIKDAQTKYIVEWAKSKRVEFDDVLNTDDSLTKEGYSNFTKPQLKKLIGYFDQVILDCQKLSGIAVKSRKPKKRKTKTPDQLVSKLNYMYEFPDLKLMSVKPTDIIGCMSLWVYNTKTRKLGVYHAEDAGGISVKGSTLLNFSETKSVQKKLRKPEVTLPEVLSAGKVTLRNLMGNIKAVESVLTGRINSDTILLKVTK
jgi:hypothetical protein